MSAIKFGESLSKFMIPIADINVILYVIIYTKNVILYVIIYTKNKNINDWSQSTLNSVF